MCNILLRSMWFVFYVSSHAINLLNNLPVSCLDVLIDLPVQGGQEKYCGKNMDVVQVLLDFMEKRIDKVKFILCCKYREKWQHCLHIENYRFLVRYMFVLSSSIHPVFTSLSSFNIFHAVMTVEMSLFCHCGFVPTNCHTGLSFSSQKTNFHLVWPFLLETTTLCICFCFPDRGHDACH